MKSIFMPLFGKNKKEIPPKQVVFKIPSRVVLEDAVKYYVDWRFPGASYCHDIKDKGWDLNMFYYDPEQNTIELKICLNDELGVELRVHLVGNAFIG
tara:strand:+ start:358 stop:648 length:291 start_codon:yes stop_codon:yes gene_type:complete